MDYIGHIAEGTGMGATGIRVDGIIELGKGTAGESRARCDFPDKETRPVGMKREALAGKHLRFHLSHKGKKEGRSIRAGC